MIEKIIKLLAEISATVTTYILAVISLVIFMLFVIVGFAITTIIFTIKDAITEKRSPLTTLRSNIKSSIEQIGIWLGDKTE